MCEGVNHLHHTLHDFSCRCLCPQSLCHMFDSSSFSLCVRVSVLILGERVRTALKHTHLPKTGKDKHTWHTHTHTHTPREETKCVRVCVSLLSCLSVCPGPAPGQNRSLEINMEANTLRSEQQISIFVFLLGAAEPAVRSAPPRSSNSDGVAATNSHPLCFITVTHWAAEQVDIQLPGRVWWRCEH